MLTVQIIILQINVNLCTLQTNYIVGYFLRPDETKEFIVTRSQPSKFRTAQPFARKQITVDLNKMEQEF